jgi:hypothetical protein
LCYQEVDHSPKQCLQSRVSSWRASLSLLAGKVYLLNSLLCIGIKTHAYLSLSRHLLALLAGNVHLLDSCFSIGF